MPKLIQILADALRRLAGAGAAENAAYEVHRAVHSVVELDAQLRGAPNFPRRAA